MLFGIRVALSHSPIHQKTVYNTAPGKLENSLDFETHTESWWIFLKELAMVVMESRYLYPLRWRHNDHEGVSYHQPHGCLLNRLFRRRSKKTSKLRVTGLCVGNLLGTVYSPHKGPVTRKMFSFDDVIMQIDVRFHRHQNDGFQIGYHDFFSIFYKKQIYFSACRGYRIGFTHCLSSMAFFKESRIIIWLTQYQSIPCCYVLGYIKYNLVGL